MVLNQGDFRDKVLGCWMGKNIGGTLGAPFEWKRQINRVRFYTQDLHGEPLPNDDLDIQLLWLLALEEQGPDLDSRTLAEYWCLYVDPHWAEYGTGRANLRAGLLPPLSGTLRNVFKHSCGAFIRSEIWACIAPARPALAARYAYADAILDHGNGEGTYGEVFCAALESAAFVVSDPRTLIDIGLSYIPRECGVAAAVKSALRCYRAKKSLLSARDEILRLHRGSAFFNRPDCVSPRDRKKGFDRGALGYDAPSNIGLFILALLYGRGDFGKTLCMAVNCGEDTDCTAATAGALFGILHGMKGIPKKWIDPIGRGIKTVALNVGDLGGALPKTVDELTERTIRMACQVQLRERNPALILSLDRSTDMSDLNGRTLFSPDRGASLYTALNGNAFRFDCFTVEIDYGANPFIRNNEPKTLRVTLRNRHRAQATVSVHWYLPPGWQVREGADCAIQSLPPWFEQPAALTFTLAAEKVERTLNRAVLELTIEGRPTVMLVPVTLMNGNAREAKEV